jgi:hypothetical protein
MTALGKQYLSTTVACSIVCDKVVESRMTWKSSVVRIVAYLRLRHRAMVWPIFCQVHGWDSWQTFLIMGWIKSTCVLVLWAGCIEQYWQCKGSSELTRIAACRSAAVRKQWSRQGVAASSMGDTWGLPPKARVNWWNSNRPFAAPRLHSVQRVALGNRDSGVGIWGAAAIGVVSTYQ